MDYGKDSRVSNEYRKEVTVIIPAYNEEKRIVPVLEEICTYIVSKGLPWKVIVSIDGNDSTENLVRGMEVKYPFLNHLKSTVRSGKGGAIKRALNIASGDYVMLMDADGAISFSEMTDHLNLIYSYDFINFDRYKDKENSIPKLRRFVSRGYNVYIRALFNLNINDTQCGYKIMKTSDAKRVFGRLTITNGFFYLPLFVYLKKLKVKTIEISVKYHHSDGSKFGVASMVLGGFVSAMAFRVRESPLWKYVPEKLIELYYSKFKWI